MNFIIDRPVVTEKSAKALMDHNQYTVFVNPDVNKIEVRKEFEKKYNVTVLAVNLIKVKSKIRRRGRIEGATKLKRKAIVFVEKGQVVEEIKKLF